MASVIIATGSALPSNIVTNDDLSKRIDTSDEWIQARTGIRQRHLAAEGEKTSDFAIKAARQAMEAADIAAASIDLVIVATTTPDETFPSVACKVQHALGLGHGPAFDVQAVCTGFLYALNVADSMLKGGQGKRALVIGAETFSRLLDWEDRTTCVLFGDGAGAVVLEYQEDPTVGILTTRLHADGSKHDILYVDGGPGSTGTVGKVKMVGKEVYKVAVSRLDKVVKEVMTEVGIGPESLDFMVPHQANKRIIDTVAKRLALTPDQVVLTVTDHANTSAASVPLAMDRAVRDGRIKKGDLVLLVAMGGGFTWGASLLRW